MCPCVGNYEGVLLGHLAALSLSHGALLVVAWLVLGGAVGRRGAGLSALLPPLVVGLSWSVAIFDSELWWSLGDAAEGASLAAAVLLCGSIHWGRSGRHCSVHLVGALLALAAWSMSPNLSGITIVHWWSGQGSVLPLGVAVCVAWALRA